MKVTFDSNLYRRLTNPTRFPNDPAYPDYNAIHSAILAGTIEPFLCATVATLEAIARDTRGDYLAGNRIKIDTQEQASPNEAIQVTMRIGADDALHPGLPRILESWLEDALALGFKFLAAPRIGQPRPEILKNSTRLAPLDQVDFEIFGEVCRAIESRGLGIAQAQAIATAIMARDPHSQPNAPWSRALSSAADIHERRAIARAVAEWSDGDAIAAHIAYRCDVFCTEDMGRSAGAPSVLAPEARDWLNKDYGLVVRSAVQLAADLKRARDV